MEKINELVDQRRYLEASILLQNLETTIGSNLNLDEGRNENDGDTKRALKAVRSELISAAEKVHFYLGKDWDENVQIITNDTNDNDITIKIELSVDESGKRRATQLVQAMKDNDMLAYRLNKFGNRLMSSVITP
jgi:hypothetical protein